MGGVVKVAYMGLVRNALGISGEEVELPDGSRLADLLALLKERHGETFERSLFTNRGELRPLVRIFIGEQSIEELDGVNTEMGPHTGVHILLLDHSLGGG